MANKTKQQLIVENNTSFPTNNAGAITATELRDFNTDMIDSTVNQGVYTTDSASFDTRIDEISGSVAVDTGSLLVTASAVSNVLTFTKGDSTTFDVTVGSDVDITDLNQFTASQEVINSNLQSFTSSVEVSIQNINTTTQSLQSEIDSLQLQTGSYLSTSSFNSYTSSTNQRVSSLEGFTSSQETYNTNNDTKWNTLGGQSGSWVTESETSSFARTDVDNTFTGNQSFDNITVSGTGSFAHINYVTGSATIIGDAFVVLNADTPTQRYAGLIVFDSGSGNTASFEWDGDIDTWIAVEETGNSAVTLTGPTGSKGSEVFPTQNKIQKGLGWNYLGDSNITDDGTIVSISTNIIVTGSITGSSLRVENNTRLDGTLTVTNDTTMTGDLLIQSSSPKLRLRDTSGGGFSSGYDLTIDTGSFIINDETHDRPVLSDIYNPSTLKHTTELTSEIIVISGSDSVTIQGQLTASLQEGYVWVGNDTGKIQPIPTSSIQTDISGLATTGSNTFIGNQVFDSVDLYLSGSGGSRLNLFQDGLSQIRFWSGSDETQVGTWVNMQTNPSNGAIAISSFPDNNHFVDFNPAVTESQFTAPIRLDGGINGNVTLNGRQTITGPTSGTTSPQLLISSSDSNVLATRQQFTFRKAGADYNGYFGRGTMYLVSEPGVGTEFTVANFDEPDFVNDVEYSVKVDENGIVFRDWDNASAFEFQTWLSIAPNLGDSPDVRFLRNIQVTGSIDVTGELTASLQQGYVWVGDVNGRTTTVSTGSFGGGGAGFPFTGSAQITGSMGITGSLSGYVNTLSVDVDNTSSMNFNDGNFFILELTGGTVTHLTPSNIRPGQTINLLVKMDVGDPSDSGSLTFSPDFKFAGGFDYSPTAITGSQDLVSFVTFDTTQVFASQVKNLS